MTRAPRQPSETGMYHIMARGINHSQLFYDNEDKAAKSAFCQLLKADTGYEAEHLGTKTAKRIDDEQAIQAILDIGVLKNCGDLCLAEKGERDRTVAALRAEGLSVRQISRLTGLSRGVVQRVEPRDGGR